MDGRSRSRGKILIVDDDKLFVSTILKILIREGFRTDTAFECNTAFNKIIKNKYDLILLDIFLPDIGGIELCKRIRERSGTHCVPIIFISSIEDGDRIYRDCLELGVIDCLKKPVTPSEVIFKIKNYLQLAKTEFKLRQNEILFRSIVNNQSEFVVRYKPDGTLTFVNTSFCNYLKKNVGEIIGTNFFKLLNINKQNEDGSVVKSINRTNSTDIVEIELPTGEKVWHRWVSRSLTDKIAHTVVIQSIGQDITEMKKNEDVLKQYEYIFKHAGWGIVAVDPKTMIFDQVNDAYAKMHGYSPEELKGSKINNVFFEGDIEFSKKIIKKINESGHYSYRSLHKRKDGKLFPALTDLTLMKYEKGNKELIIGNIQDITKTLKTTKALIESEERFRTIFRNTPDIVAIVRISDLAIVDINDKIFGYSNLKKRNIIGKPGFLIKFFKDHSDITRLLNILDNNDTVANVEIVLKAWDMRDFPVLISCSKILLNGILHIVAIIRNIEEIKRYQESLQRSETKFRLLADYNYNWEFWLGPDGNYIYVSPSCERITGYKPEDFEKDPKLMEKLIHPDYISTCSEHFGEAHIGGGPEISLEMIIVDRYGNEKWISHMCNAVFDENGKFIGRRGNNQDITQKKLSELELLKLSTAIEQSSSAILITDINGIIEYVNPYFEKLTGYKYDEAVGGNPRILKSGKTDPQIYTDLWKSISSGQIWQGEFINKKKNGELFIDKSIITPVKNKNSKIVNYIAIKQDITKQKEGDRKILQTIISTEEKERIRFAQDLHDDLGPLLSTAKLYIKTIESAKDNFNKQTAIDKSLEAIDGALISIKEIAYSLSPHILRDFGLISAITSLIHRLNETGSIKIRINSKTQERFDENLESSVFRIMAELINNTIKHAQANQIEIKIIRRSDELHITYFDDGIGYEPEKELNKKLSFGLSNIINRVKSLGGKIIFDTNKGNNDVRVFIFIPVITH
jgi:PAS domain S-box-containing protein